MPRACAAASPAASCEATSSALRTGSGPEVETLAQRLALEQLHGGVGCLAVASEVEDRQDVGMRERGDRLGLALEARERFGVCGKMLRQHLDRHLAVELGVAGAEDLAHAAFAELGGDLVGAQLLSDHRVPIIGSRSSSRGPGAREPVANHDDLGVVLGGKRLEEQEAVAVGGCTPALGAKPHLVELEQLALG